ncbi:putative myosin light chain kinase [Paramyrothecium foliicola]|nr:putative myosin light chain kinase [Paramyrothecium foliicola]
MADLLDFQNLSELVRGSQLKTRFWSEGSQHYTAHGNPGCWDEEVWVHGDTETGRESYILLQQKKTADDTRPQLRAVKSMRITDAAASLDKVLTSKIEVAIKFSQPQYSGLFVHTRGWFIKHDRIYLAMEYCELGSLQQFMLDSENGPRKSLPEDQAREIASQVLSALVMLHHEQICHGDLKPSNILIKSHHPEPWKITLINFGTSMVSGTSTQYTRITRKPQFTPPESLKLMGGPTGIDPFAVDVWCLGETLFQIFCGRVAFSNYAELTDYIHTGKAYLEPDLVSASIGDSAISLLCALLAVDPFRRPSAENALEHPWNTNEIPTTTSPLRKEMASPSMSLLAEWSSILPSNLSVITEELSALKPALAHNRPVIPVIQEDASQALRRYFGDDITEYVHTVASYNDVALVENHGGPCSRQASLISHTSRRTTSEALQDEQLATADRPGSLDLSLKNEPIRLRSRGKTLWNTATTSSDKGNLKQKIHGLWIERETKKLCRHIMRLRTESLGRKEEASLVASMSDLHRILLRENMTEFASQFFRETISIREKKYGEKDRVLVHAMDHLATVYMEKQEWDTASEILALSLKLKSEMLHKDNNLAWGANQLVDATVSASRWVEPEATCQQLIELGELLLRTISQASTSEKPGFATSTDGYREAEQIFQAALRLAKAAFGIKHEILPEIMDRIALCLSVQGYFDDSERLYLLTLRLKDARLGRSHASTLRTMEGLATMLRNNDKLTAADAFFGYLIELRTKALGAKHPHTLTSMHDRSDTLFFQKKYVEAERSYWETLSLRREVLGDEHPDTLKTMHQIGTALVQQSIYVEAEDMLQNVVKLRSKVLGPDHLETLQSKQCLTVARNKQKRGSKARYLGLEPKKEGS